jgi:hypothetical protein
MGCIKRFFKLDLVQTTTRPEAFRPAVEWLRQVNCLKFFRSNHNDVILFIFLAPFEVTRSFFKNKIN